MRHGLEHTRYVEDNGQWFVETLTGFDQDHEPIYARNPTPMHVDLLGENHMEAISRHADGSPVMGLRWTKWPTHQIDHEGKLQPFRHPTSHRK